MYLIALFDSINPKWAVFKKKAKCRFILNGRIGNFICPPRQHRLGKVRPLVIWKSTFTRKAIERACENSAIIEKI